MRLNKNTWSFYKVALLPIDLKQFSRNSYKFKRQSFDSKRKKITNEGNFNFQGWEIIFVNLSSWRVAPQEIIINSSLLWGNDHKSMQQWFKQWVQERKEMYKPFTDSWDRGQIMSYTHKSLLYVKNKEINQNKNT